MLIVRIFVVCFALLTDVAEAQELWNTVSGVWNASPPNLCKE